MLVNGLAGNPQPLVGLIMRFDKRIQTPTVGADLSALAEFSALQMKKLKSFIAPLPIYRPTEER